MFFKTAIFKTKNLLHRCYAALVKTADGPNASRILAAVSFLESSCFPIPPDALLIPMMVADPKKSLKFAGVCTLFSVIGGAAGYLIGWFLYDAVAVPIFTFYGYMDQLHAFIEMYNKYGIWFVAAAGFTPFPYKVITITSGMTHLNFGVFMLASIVSRGARFYLLGILFRRFGAGIQTFIEKNLGWLATAFFLLLAGGFALIKYI